MSHILIMTDSTCDLPADWVKQYQIRVVPTYVQFGPESLADDGIQLTRADFYRRLVSDAVLPTTAAPPPGQTREMMTQALDVAEHVIAFTAPAQLSGIYNTFRMAAEQTDPDRVTLIDSGMVSMGLGWQVLIAAEMAKAGASPTAIAAANHDLQPRSVLWAALDTMHYLRRSGRVSWASVIVGDLCQIKPVIRLQQSVISSVARVRTARRTFQTLVDLAHQAAPLDRLAIIHTNYIDGARRLRDALKTIHPATELAIIEVTPVLGVHVGPKALGLSVVQQSHTG